MNVAQNGDKPSLEALQRQFAAGVRGTLADMIQTAQQSLGMSSVEAERFVIEQATLVGAYLRTGNKEGGT